MPPPRLTIVMPVYNELRDAAHRPRPPAGRRACRCPPRSWSSTTAPPTGASTPSRTWVDRGPGHARAPAAQPGQGRGAAARHRRGRPATCSPILDADLEYDPADFAGPACSPILDGDARVVYGARSYGGHAAYSFWFVLGQQGAGPVGQRPVRRLADRHRDLPQGGPHRPVAPGRPAASTGFGIEAEVTGKFLRMRRAHLRGRRSPTGPAGARRARRSSGPTASRPSGS